MKKSIWPKVVSFCIVSMGLTTCAPQQRMGMVLDPGTGLQYGSVIEKIIVVDSSQFANRRIKVNIRNTSGDPTFDLYGFRGQLERAYARKGYQPTQGSDFGILVDINVRYSGQASRTMTKQFAFLGGAGGAIAGLRSSGNTGAAIGALAGVTLGSIIGGYISEDTYIVVAGVSLGVSDINRGKRETTITFSSSKSEKMEEDKGFKPFRQMLRTGIAAYAGGRNISQQKISQGVRQRFLLILSDVI